MLPEWPPKGFRLRIPLSAGNLLPGARPWAQASKATKTEGKCLKIEVEGRPQSVSETDSRQGRLASQHVASGGRGAGSEAEAA